jgi:hypothetical protein
VGTDQFGLNALGETLEPSRVADCYLGLLLPPGPAGEPEAGTVLIVTPAALLHPDVPQPAGSLVYELLTGYWGSRPSCTSGRPAILHVGSKICTTSSATRRSCWWHGAGSGATRVRAPLVWTARRLATSSGSVVRRRFSPTSAPN